MKAAEALLCLKFAALAYGVVDVPRPRGVSPKHARHYNDLSGTFTCILNPSIKIPIDRVNDDYCDCPDGSDEPGTSACAYITPLSPRTPADVPLNTANYLAFLPGFWCANKGHKPGYVPFSNVNDGKCDYDLCCDGSEEWQGIGGVKCEDRCKDIGKEWRKQDEARQKSLGNATKKRKELLAQAARMRKEVQDRMQTLGTEIEGAELRVKQLEAELVEVERKEKGKVVKSKEGQTGGKLGVLVGLAKQRTGELRDNLVKVREERDDYYGRLAELEELLSTFKEEYNPNFNDEGVKRAVRTWEDYAARGKGRVPSDLLNLDLDEITKTDKENGLDWEEYETPEESDTDVLYAFENYLPPSLRGWLDQKLRDLRVTLIDAGILASISDSGESKLVSDARNRLETAKRDLEEHRNDLKSRTEDLEKDFGAEDVFRALKGTCISTDSGEYTYELCFMERTTQKPKKGGGGTNMGNFVRFETITVDDTLPANGKGLGSGERIAMKYENGQHCWHGPNRSSLVVLACAEENEIWKIVEEEKCVYRLEVGTPAVCEKGGQNGNGNGKGGDPNVKDEL